MARKTGYLVQRITILLLLFVLCGHAAAQDRDTELSNLANKLTTQITNLGRTKVAVVDFTDSQGGASKLGKYIAEQLNMDILLGKHEFEMWDHVTLNNFLSEHNLSAKSLTNPDNTKLLDSHAGVDTLILGIFVFNGQTISVTARVITADTAEMIGIGRAQFNVDAGIQRLMPQAAAEAGAVTDETATMTKTLGDLNVGLQSLRIVDDGRQYLLTMTLSNKSPDKSAWVAMSGGADGLAHQTVNDPNGFAFVNADRDVTGVASTLFQKPMGFFTEATEVKPGDSISATIRFTSPQDRSATAGRCDLHLGFLLGDDFKDSYGKCTPENLAASMNAE